MSYVSLTYESNFPDDGVLWNTKTVLYFPEEGMTANSAENGIHLGEMGNGNEYVVAQHLSGRLDSPGIWTQRLLIRSFDLLQLQQDVDAVLLLFLFILSIDVIDYHHAFATWTCLRVTIT